MAIQTTLPALKNLMSQDNVKQRFYDMMGKKSVGFMSSVINVVNNNVALQDADANSIMLSAAVAATLDLPIDPNLGLAAIVPYNCKVKGENGVDVWVKKAQFQMMYKGFIQLAQRSGQYASMNACEIFEGELISENRITGDIVFDHKMMLSEKIVGYAAHFKLLNGFEKVIYWSTEKVLAHGKRYSKSFALSTGRWKQDLPAMAMKTVIKNLISKFGPLSIDIQMQRAVILDQSVPLSLPDAEGNIEPEYPDNPKNEGIEEAVEIAEKEKEKPTATRSGDTKAATVTDNLKKEIEACKDISALTDLQTTNPYLAENTEFKNLVASKSTALTGKLGL